jgi:hypothetical protein
MTIPAIKKRRFEEPWEWLKLLVSRDQIYYIYIYIYNQKIRGKERINQKVLKSITHKKKIKSSMHVLVYNLIIVMCCFCRKNRGKLTWTVIIQAFFCGLFG